MAERFYDMVLRRTRHWPIHEAIGRAHLIVADNIADYVYEHHFITDGSKRGGYIKLSIPTMAPPLPTMFIDIKAPRTIGGSPWNGMAEWGVFIESLDLDPDIPTPCGDHFAHGGRWEISCSILVNTNGPTLLAVHRFLLGRDGRPIRCELDHHLHDVVFGPEVLNDDESERVADSASTEYLMTALMTIAFMHCKNVTRTEVVPTLPRNARRRGEKPPTRYHVLNIGPMNEVIRTEGQSDTVGLQRALHICRGHFKTYTEEKPLLGKITGMFWWEAHVRGNASEGIVLKDYNVNPTPSL